MVGSDWGRRAQRAWRALAAVAALGLMTLPALAQETVCARVKIEIKQELTLERQAFDAEMKINNTTDAGVVENVRVEVKVTEEDGTPVSITTDPNNLAAKFFIRLSGKENISDVDGTGSVGPQTTATMNWLLIPAPGAAGNNPLGKKYLVGARLTYRFGGEDTVLEINADARRMMEERWTKLGMEITEARLRMARIPVGATLIENAESAAPGFSIGGAHVMAGVPSVFRSMVEALVPRLNPGRPPVSETIRVDRPESDVADGLREVAREPFRVSYAFNPQTLSAGRVMALLSEQPFEIRDIAIQEADIEAIIRKLYTGRGGDAR